MSMFGDIAVEGQMRKLLEYMESIKALPAAEQIELIAKYVREIEAAAKSGWL